MQQNYSEANQQTEISQSTSQQMLDTLAENVANYIRGQGLSGDTGSLEAPQPFHWIPSGLNIAGIERTQAIQYFNFNGQGSGYASDNSVALVARKTTILRVYPNRYGRFLSFGTVTGEVKYSRYSGGWTPEKTLTPINGPLPQASSSSINRGSADSTLNFRVPAFDCVGWVRFTATVFVPSPTIAPVSGRSLENNTSLTSQPMTVYAYFGDVPRVRVHAVLIHYTGGGQNIPAPSGLDMINTLAWVARVYPISGFDYTGCTEREFNGDLRVGGGGGCGVGWGKLMTMLWNMRVASGTDDIYVGLLPTGANGGGILGCGGSSRAVAFVGDDKVMAQEIGHALGRAHAPCGVVGDPNYPNYDAYPSASIGEFGFDSKTSDVHDPATTFDYMSYCFPNVWTSPYTYMGLRNTIVSSAAAMQPFQPETRQADETILLNFSMDRDGHVRMDPSYVLPGLTPRPEMGPLSPVSCEFRNWEGEVVEYHRCHYDDPHFDPHGPYVEFHETIPWGTEVRSIQFQRDGEVVHTIEIEDESPVVYIQPVERGGRQDELIRIDWACSHPDTETTMTYLLRYRCGPDEPYTCVAAGLTETSCVANSKLLAGGEECNFQVVASSGIRTTVAETDTFSVPQKARQAHIISPEPSAGYVQGEPVVLQGGGFSPDCGTTEFEDVGWSSSVDGFLGTGYEVIADSLSVGRHRIVVAMPDGYGGEASAGVFIDVRPRP